MLKRPQSPSNIPMPIQRDGSFSNTQRTSPRTSRKLPQPIVPSAPKHKPATETRIPAPLSAKSTLIAMDGRETDDKRYDSDTSGINETESQKAGVIYITENLIKKITKEDNFSRIIHLTLAVPKDLNKKIKYIENLDSLKNLKTLSIRHNAIEKMERLDKLVNLEMLDLSDNLLTRIEGIGNLDKLTVLNVEDNLIESIPAFLGKKLKYLTTLKIARNKLQSRYELYKLRNLPDLVELTTEGNPLHALPHQWHYTIFLLRSLEILNGEKISDEDRMEADERFKQDELCRLESALEKSERNHQECMVSLENAKEKTHELENANLKLRNGNEKMKDVIGGLQKDIDSKNQLLESKTKELSKACEKQFKLEQELAFYKLDTKFDEFWKFTGYEPEDDDSQYIDEDQSAYIGKARFKPNSMANERILPSKTQMINFIKLVRRKDEKMNEINKTILHDLEEALNIDLEEKQAAILQAEKELERLKSECKKLETGLVGDDTDYPKGLAGIEEREKMREDLANLIQQVEQLQATIMGLQNQMVEREELLHKRQKEIETLKDQFDTLSDDDPQHDKLLEAISAREEQCFQLEDDISQLNSLLTNTERELIEKEQAIAALERKLRIGEPLVQNEMKQGLESMIEKLTNYCEELKQQMQKQEKLNNGLVKERDSLKRKIEELEDEIDKAYKSVDDIDGIRINLVDREDALKEQVEINQGLRDKLEKLLQKVNKKKRHVGIGSHDVWRDPKVEMLMEQLKDAEDEIARLRHELEKLKKQKDAERKAAEQRLEEEQAKLDEAVLAARNAGDVRREAKELERQLQRLQAEKMAMRQQVNGLQEDLNREKSESIPWKSLSKHVQALLDDIDSGVVERLAPIASTSQRDKRLHRAFDDLRDRLTEHYQQNEEEKEADQKQLRKLHAKVEQLQDDFGTAQLELSRARKAAVQAEQDLNDANEQLDQTQSRLRNALNDRANNAKKEANELRSKLEEADRKMRAVEQLAKEAEMDYENAREESEELKRQLKKANDEKNSLAKAYKTEAERLQELLEDKEADKEQADKNNEQLQEKLADAKKRMAQAEGRAKQLQKQLQSTQAEMEELKKEVDALRNQQKNEEDVQKGKLESAKDKLDQMKKAFENEAGELRNELNKDKKYIANLKEQLKRGKDEFTNELHLLAEEISELQAELSKTETKFRKAEESNNRLLDNLAKIEDENNELNDRLHSVETQAASLIENERILHAKELKNLEDEIDNLKNLLSQLQLSYDSKAYEREKFAIGTLSQEIDALREKVTAAEQDSAGRELHHRKFKKRLSDEINKLQQVIENRGYEERLLHDKNRLKQQTLEYELNSLLDHISDLKRTLEYREMELASLRDSAQPLMANFRSRIKTLVEKLQNKEKELKRLQSHLNELSTHQPKYLITHGPHLDNLSNDLEDVKNSITDLRNNIAGLLSSLQYEGGNVQQTFVPLRSSALEKTRGSSASQLHSPALNPAPTSPIYHHHYGAVEELPMESIVSSSANVGNTSVHVHHHNHNQKERKKRKSSKKTMDYTDHDHDDYDEEFCNIPEHEEMDDQMKVIESRLRNSTLTRSRLSNSSPIKLELKHLQAKVEDAITRRHRLKHDQQQRQKYEIDSL